jgi:hypothetical protein
LHKFGFCVKFVKLYKRLSSCTSLGFVRNSWNYKRLSSHTSLGFVWNSWTYMRDWAHTSLGFVWNSWTYIRDWALTQVWVLCEIHELIWEIELSHKFGFCVKFMNLYKRLSSHTKFGFVWNTWNFWVQWSQH